MRATADSATAGQERFELDDQTQSVVVTVPPTTRRVRVVNDRDSEGDIAAYHNGVLLGVIRPGRRLKRCCWPGDGLLITRRGGRARGAVRFG